MGSTDRERVLDEAQAGGDPLVLFAQWYGEAQAANVSEPDAMTLATATAQGEPSARIVLMRGFDERGFTFYTNYLSRKAGELAANPRAALIFYWPEFKRQVRIEGTVEQVSSQESDVYFQTRPVGHQLSSWVSSQSKVIPDRKTLEQTMAELAARFSPDADALPKVPRPPFWGGFRVYPQIIEFWQGRENRLHDRLLFRRNSSHGWDRERLAP